MESGPGSIRFTCPHVAVEPGEQDCLSKASPLPLSSKLTAHFTTTKEFS